MASLTQLGAVSGRRIKPSSVDIINAQTPYLPGIYQRRQDKAYNDKMYNLEVQGLNQAKELEEKQLAQNQAIAKQNYSLAKAAQQQQEEQAKKARKIGYYDLGIKGLTGLASIYNAYKPETAVADVAQSVIPTTISNVLPSAIPNVLESVPINPTEAIGVSGLPNTSGLQDLVDIIPEPIKNIGEAVWDYGSNLYDEATDFLSGLFS